MHDVNLLYCRLDLQTRKDGLQIKVDNVVDDASDSQRLLTRSAIDLAVECVKVIYAAYQSAETGYR